MFYFKTYIIYKKNKNYIILIIKQVHIDEMTKFEIH